MTVPDAAAPAFGGAPRLAGEKAGHCVKSSDKQQTQWLGVEQ